MNYESAASQLVRALRGKRSQPALSRRLGYSSNVVYLWEAGRAHPTAAKAMGLAQRVGIEPGHAIARFHRRPPAWVTDQDFTDPLVIARWLDELRGRNTVAEVARKMKRDRYAVTRWLKGTTQPRLPELLLFVEVCTLRSLDFIACFVDPTELRAVKRHWIALQASRETVDDAPWSHAVLRALELTAYRNLPRHQPGWIAARVGITEDEEQRCLTLLSRARQIRWNQRRWQVRAAATIDTGLEPRTARKLAHWCAHRATQQLAAEKPGNFAFNLFTVSERDLEKLRQLQRDYFSQLRSIIAASQPAERLVVANMQLFLLDETEPEASSNFRPSPQPG